jgi:hypothetical protein
MEEEGKRKEWAFVTAPGAVKTLLDDPPNKNAQAVCSLGID